MPLELPVPIEFLEQSPPPICIVTGETDDLQVYPQTVLFRGGSFEAPQAVKINLQLSSDGLARMRKPKIDTNALRLFLVPVWIAALGAWILIDQQPAGILVPLLLFMLGWSLYARFRPPRGNLPEFLRDTAPGRVLIRFPQGSDAIHAAFATALQQWRHRKGIDIEQKIGEDDWAENHPGNWDEAPRK